MELDLVVTTLARALAFSTPLLWAALGEIVVERAGVVNLGVEGMMILGALADDPRAAAPSPHRAIIVGRPATSR